MNRQGHETVNFFVGTEVEHSPAYGKKTLFVVGIQDADSIMDMALANDCKHIYFGANQSFPRLDINDGDSWQSWEHMITACMHGKFLCTLDLDVAQAEGLLESSLVENNLFIPMISVKLPYIRQFGYNAVLKIDDKDFAKSNPGVWCHSLHDLQNKEVFTDWSKYTQDEIIQ
jgi:hypothetical protein